MLPPRIPSKVSQQCRRFFVSGRVQGVFFRASTAAQASRLGVRGWARNLPDGRVEVLASGTSEAMAKLADWLQSGPPLAVVSSVESCVADDTDGDDLTDFRTA